MAYVVRQEVEVPVIVPPLANWQPYSDEYGSVEASLIASASHGHLLSKEDNAAVYYLLEEATQSTGYAASIKPFQRQKNGRAAVGKYQVANTSYQQIRRRVAATWYFPTW